MLKRRLPLLALSVFSLVGLQVSGLMASPAAPGFHAAVQMPNSTGGTEPSLAISNDGIRYVSWQAPAKFAGSADGVSVGALATPDAGAAGDVTNAVSYSGALYNGQICGGATKLHSCIYRSLDGGKHWTTQNILADNHPGASDRPWIDVYPKQNSTSTASNPDKDTVYLEYHTFSPDDLVYVTVSTDGGKTFSSPQIHIALSTRHDDDPLGFVTQCQVNQGICEEAPKATDLYLVTSPDGGQHWTEPFQINKTTGSFFFPWLSAGSAGIIDATYYSSTTLQPNKPSSVWYVGLSQITGGVATYSSGAHAMYT